MSCQVPGSLCPGYSYCTDRNDGPRLLSHTHGHLSLKGSQQIRLFQPKGRRIPQGYPAEKQSLTRGREGVRALAPRQSLWVLPHSPGKVSLHSPAAPGKTALVVLPHSWLRAVLPSPEQEYNLLLASIRFSALKGKLCPRLRHLSTCDWTQAVISSMIHPIL